MAASIPAIDLSSYETESAAASEVRRACESVGFFYLQGHGVSTRALNEAFEYSRRFFALPIDQKRGILASLSTKNRGYTPMAEETLDVNNQSVGDQKEGLYFGREVLLDSLDASLPLHGPNLWPSEEVIPGFRKVIETYIGELNALAFRLLRLFSLALGLDASALDSKFHPPMTFLRPLRYAPVKSSPEEGVFGAGAHSDYGMLTILATDEVPGLEVLLHGTWIQVNPLPGTFIINLGDLFQRWSGGRFKSTVHRVVNRLGKERYSIPFFFEPRFDTLLEPLIPSTSPIEIDAKSQNGAESYGVIPEKIMTSGEYLIWKYNSTHAGYADPSKTS